MLLCILNSIVPHWILTPDWLGGDFFFKTAAHFNTLPFPYWETSHLLISFLFSASLYLMSSQTTGPFMWKTDKSWTASARTHTLRRCRPKTWRGTWAALCWSSSLRILMTRHRSFSEIHMRSSFVRTMCWSTLSRWEKKYNVLRFIVFVPGQDADSIGLV